jgi:hypothetical protein
MNEMYVYGLRDPRASGVTSVRYVGVSANPTRRLHRHVRAARRREGSPVARWLRSLRRRPALDILTVTTREQAVNAERAAIATLRERGADLVNRSAGGDGLITAEHVALLAEGMRRLWTKADYRDRYVALMRARWTDPRMRARWLRAMRRNRGTPPHTTRERTAP